MLSAIFVSCRQEVVPTQWGASEAENKHNDVMFLMSMKLIMADHRYIFPRQFRWTYGPTPHCRFNNTVSFIFSLFLIFSTSFCIFFKSAWCMFHGDSVMTKSIMKGLRDCHTPWQGIWGTKCPPNFQNCWRAKNWLPKRLPRYRTVSCVWLPKQ